MSSVNAMYGYNPYMSTGLNDDFMYNATNTQYAQLAQQQALLQQAALQQPTADTFQKSEGGSGFGTGLKFAAIGGIGAGAGAYFFGDKLGAGFVKDGKFSDELLRTVEDIPGQTQKLAEQKLANAKTRILKRFNLDDETYNAIKKFAKAKDVNKLTPEVKQLVQQAGIKNQSEAITKLTQIKADFKKIDTENMVKKSTQVVESGSLKGQTAKLTKLQARENLMHTLADNAKQADIEKLITENSEKFGIKGDKAVIEKEAKALAGKFKTKAGGIKAINAEVSAQQQIVNTMRTNLNGRITAHWDDAAKAFKADAPEALTKAAKKFKLAKAGKFAAIAAGVGLVIGWLTGSSK